MQHDARQAEIRRLESAFWQSLVDRDANAATAMLAPEALMVSSHGTMRFDPAQYTKMLDDPKHGLLEYSPSDMDVLWPRRAPGVDLVNGVKISRSDPWHRIVIGRIYHHTVKAMFGLRVRDVDCDFRMMRRSIFDRVRLEKNSGVICLEMMKKIQDAGFTIVEVPVHHYHRAHGRSQFFNVRRVFRTGIDVLKLWFVLVVRRTHRRGGAAAEPLGQRTRV